MTIHPGQRVRLKVPENPRLHGALAEVSVLTSYGAVVRCAAAATGQFRALFQEMEPLHQCTGKEAREQGYTGDSCDRCGSLKIKRIGTCLLCYECGETSGCG